MNHRKLLPARIIYMALFSLVIMSGCTKRFDEINTDPTRITSLATADIKGLFTRAEYMAMYAGDGSAEYQYAQGFYADLYCQYSAITATFDPTDRYNIVQEWLQEQWIGTFRALAPLQNILKETSTPEKKRLMPLPASGKCGPSIGPLTITDQYLILKLVLTAHRSVTISRKIFIMISLKS